MSLEVSTHRPCTECSSSRLRFKAISCADSSSTSIGFELPVGMKRILKGCDPLVAKYPKCVVETAYTLRVAGSASHKEVSLSSFLLTGNDSPVFWSALEESNERIVLFG